jgi:hypothetical protein
VSPDRRPLEGRELDALLERLDNLTEAVDRIGRRLDTLEGVNRMSRELAHLTRALESLAYAALGVRGPHVRRPPE